jgi:hypothetical protein
VRIAAVFDGDERLRREIGGVERGEEVVVAAKVIRRVGVDDGEWCFVRCGSCFVLRASCFGVSGLEERDRVSGNCAHIRVPLFRQFVDAGDGRFADVDRDGGFRAARDCLERERAAAGEEVEEVSTCDAAADDVEERLARAFGGRANVARRYRDAAATQRARGDAEGVYCADLLPTK